uniref:EF-hand domain-containing protein n=1 Tax=Pyrodinium bahamense TaxID=73915 RepID=A0A7S0FU66_9DINO|mmetsp:Transcript_49002/g.136177  ORF Transcript_49002/g.136177 Transcript_49002/m.136177 type:complete len:653 (+) Transcript_49002:43-2001(+)
MPRAPYRPCLLPECTTSCATGTCDSHFMQSLCATEWRNPSALQQHCQQSLGPQASTTGLHAIVGRGLEELHHHVATEVRRLQVLLESGPLLVPQGDAPVPDPGTSRPLQPGANSGAEPQASHLDGRSAKDCDVLPMDARPISSRWAAGWGKLQGPADAATCAAVVARVDVRQGYSCRAPDSGVLQASCQPHHAPTSPAMGVVMSGWTSCGSEIQATNAKRREEEEAKRRNVSEESPPPTRIQKLVGSHSFELFWIGAVMLNSILLGVQTQFAAMHLGQEEPLSLRIIQHCFSILFMVELGLRVFAVGCIKLFTGPDKAWAIFDVIIIIFSFLEILMDTVISTMQDDGFANTGNVRTMRIVRLARFMRCLRVQRLIRLVSGLRTLVFSIAATLKSLFWALMLLLIIMYMVSVTLTQVVVDYLVAGDPHAPISVGIGVYWRSLDVSMFTLFKSISGGLSWHDAVTSLAEVSVALAWIFTAYVAFTYFAVMNVMTGVFCNSAIESAQRNPDVIAQNLISNRQVYVQNLEKLFTKVDEDANVLITFDEFEKVLTNPENRAFLTALEIEATDAWTLFKLIDTDGDGAIQKDEFVAGCLQLKGVARNFEMVGLQNELKRLEKKLLKFMNRVEEVRDLLKQSLGTESRSLGTESRASHH